MSAVGRVFHHSLAAILFGLVGVLLVTLPVISAEVATVVMAMFFLTGGLFQLIASFAVGVARAGVGRQWTESSRLAWAQWFLRNGPASGILVIGLFIGIDLIFYSVAWIALALGLRAM